jgi:hypothetical protein
LAFVTTAHVGNANPEPATTTTQTAGNDNPIVGNANPEPAATTTEAVGDG